MVGLVLVVGLACLTAFANPPLGGGFEVLVQLLVHITRLHFYSVYKLEWLDCKSLSTIQRSEPDSGLTVGAPTDDKVQDQRDIVMFFMVYEFVV